jgi:hypothetical protein
VLRVVNHCLLLGYCWTPHSQWLLKLPTPAVGAVLTAACITSMFCLGCMCLLEGVPAVCR